MLREMLKGVLPGLEGEVLSSNCEHVETEGDPDNIDTVRRLYALWDRQERQGALPFTHASAQDGRVVVVVTRSFSATVAEAKSEMIRILTPARAKVRIYTSQELRSTTHAIT